MFCILCNHVINTFEKEDYVYCNNFNCYVPYMNTCPSFKVILPGCSTPNNQVDISSSEKGV